MQKNLHRTFPPLFKTFEEAKAKTEYFCVVFYNIPCHIFLSSVLQGEENLNILRKLQQLIALRSNHQFRSPFSFCIVQYVASGSLGPDPSIYCIRCDSHSPTNHGRGCISPEGRRPMFFFALSPKFRCYLRPKPLSSANSFAHGTGISFRFTKNQTPVERIVLLLLQLKELLLPQVTGKNNAAEKAFSFPPFSLIEINA